MNYKYFLSLVLTACINLMFAQETTDETFTIPLSNPGEMVTLDVSLHEGSIIVEGYDGSEVKVTMKAFHSEKKEQSEVTKNGLKRIPNRSLDIAISEEDNVVDIEGGFSGRTDFIVQIPRNANLDINTHHDGDVTVRNINGDMEINCHHGDLTMESIGGTVVANTHHGEIKIGFNSISSGKPMAFSTYHGNVDITFPAGAGFDAKVKSKKGEIYTDFDVNMELQKAQENTSDSGRKEIKIGGWMYGTIGGGGQEYSFQSYHGDIILRKG